jgi:hypothetical protein
MRLKNSQAISLADSYNTVESKRVLVDPPVETLTDFGPASRMNDDDQTRTTNSSGEPDRLVHNIVHDIEVETNPDQTELVLRDNGDELSCTLINDSSFSSSGQISLAIQHQETRDGTEVNNGEISEAEDRDAAETRSDSPVASSKSPNFVPAEKDQYLSGNSVATNTGERSSSSLKKYRRLDSLAKSVSWNDDLATSVSWNDDNNSQPGMTVPASSSFLKKSVSWKSDGVGSGATPDSNQSLQQTSEVQLEHEEPSTVSDVVDLLRSIRAVSAVGYTPPSDDHPRFASALPPVARKPFIKPFGRSKPTKTEIMKHQVPFFKRLALALGIKRANVLKETQTCREIIEATDSVDCKFRPTDNPILIGQMSEESGLCMVTSMEEGKPDTSIMPSELRKGDTTHDDKVMSPPVRMSDNGAQKSSPLSLSSFKVLRKTRSSPAIVLRKTRHDPIAATCTMPAFPSELDSDSDSVTASKTISVPIAATCTMPAFPSEQISHSVTANTTISVTKLNSPSMPDKPRREDAELTLNAPLGTAISKPTSIANELRRNLHMLKSSMVKELQVDMENVFVCGDEYGCAVKELTNES